jgi:hypothetical protein
MTLQAIISISPYPQRLLEEFQIKGYCISDDYEIDPEPSVVGQYVHHGKVALTVITHVVPKPPVSVVPAPSKGLRKEG